MVVVTVVREHAKRSRPVVVPALFAHSRRIENADNGQKGIEMAKSRCHRETGRSSRCAQPA
uniref:Uncharacterized protein n=1 Tax=Ectopseudomonas oleovorans TaxID=301 RepID=A0A653B4N0_ECTOL